MTSLLKNLNRLSKTYNEALPSLSPDEQLISIHIYRLIAAGKSVSHKQVADSAGLPLENVDEIIDNWIGVFHNDKNEIIGYLGIALEDMPHKFEIDDKKLYTWCAWDGLFIPELMRKTAKVESTDPASKKKIRFTVSGGGIKNLEPSTAVMSYVKPEYTKFDENVINSFCHFIYFFESEETGNQWVANNDNAALMSMDDAFELAKRKNEYQYPDFFITENLSRIE